MKIDVGRKRWQIEFLASAMFNPLSSISQVYTPRDIY